MTPGSPIAKSFGCFCPEAENNFGCVGAASLIGGVGRWMVVESCPIHGVSAWRIPSEQKSSGWDERPEIYGYVKLNDSLPGQFGSIEIIEVKTEDIG